MFMDMFMGMSTGQAPAAGGKAPAMRAPGGMGAMGGMGMSAMGSAAAARPRAQPTAPAANKKPHDSFGDLTGF